MIDDLIELVYVGMVLVFMAFGLWLYYGHPGL